MLMTRRSFNRVLCELIDQCICLVLCVEMFAVDVCVCVSAAVDHRLRSQLFPVRNKEEVAAVHEHEEHDSEAV